MLNEREREKKSIITSCSSSVLYEEETVSSQVTQPTEFDVDYSDVAVKQTHNDSLLCLKCTKKNGASGIKHTYTV